MWAKPTLFHRGKSTQKNVLRKNKYSHNQLTKATTTGVLQKKLFLKISRMSQENTCV